MNRHEQRKAATHQKILDAAQALVAEKGYLQVEIMDITERANVSKGTFYKHFSDKEDCVRELIEDGFAALIDDMRQERSNRADMPVLEWTRYGLTRLFRWVHENRQLMLVMLGNRVSPRLNALSRQHMSETVSRVISAELDHAPHDVPDDVPKEVAVQMMTGLLIQTLGWWVEHGSSYQPQDMARILLNFMNGGMLHLLQSSSTDTTLHQHTITGAR